MRLVTTVLLLLSGPLWADERRVAFFGIHMLDSSLQTTELGQSPEEINRLKMLENMVRKWFSDNGYALVDLAPVAEDFDRVVNPAKCYGCDTRMAAKLDADFSLVGEVQKVSNLIIAMNLQLRDVTTGKTVKGGVIEIRGNTDESWRRGMRYILKNRIFREETK